MDAIILDMPNGLVKWGMNKRKNSIMKSRKISSRALSTYSILDNYKYTGRFFRIFFLKKKNLNFVEKLDDSST